MRTLRFEGTRRYMGAAVVLVALCGTGAPAPAFWNAADDALPAALASVLPRGTAGLQIFEIEPEEERLGAVALRLFLKPASAHQRGRIVETTRAALRLFDEWYGVYPHDRLIIIDVPWHSALAGASYPGVITINTRWWAPIDELSLERTILAAVARQYWQGATPPGETAGWFKEGLVLYSGARAIHDFLDGRHLLVHRYFGGFVPHAVRSVVLTPRARDPRPRMLHFAELVTPPDAPWRAWPVKAGGEAQRAALALATLERYLGWPALQQALMTYRLRFAGGRGTPDGFADVLSEQRGVDMSWFFDEAFRFEARFDYAVADLTSTKHDVPRTRYETVVRLERRGDGVFAGTSRPAIDGVGGARSLPVLVTFRDGTQVRDWWDGRQPSLTLVYDSVSPAVSASVDPELFLLLDADRVNNTRVIKGSLHAGGTRAAFHWMAWLQQAMLTSVALL